MLLIREQKVNNMSFWHNNNNNDDNKIIANSQLPKQQNIAV